MALNNENISIWIRLRDAARFRSEMGKNAAATSAFGAKTKRAGGLARSGLMVAGSAAALLGVGMFKLGEQFNDAYDVIRVGTGRTGKALEGLKGDFRAVVTSVPADFKSAGAAVDEINKRLGLTGKPLQALAKQFLELSRITGTDVSTNVRGVARAFGDWEIKTKDQSATLDRFFRASQASGASVDALASQVVKFGAPLRQVGFSLDESIAMFANFEKAGVNTQTMMPGIKMAMKSFFEKGIDPKKGLVAAFRGIQDGSIDASKAIKIFGVRAAGDMIEAVKQGRFDLDAMTKSLVDGKDTINDASKDTIGLVESWQLFKNRAMVGLEPMLVGLTVVLDKLGVVIERLPGALGGLISVLRAVLSPFTALVKAVTSNKAAMIALSPIAAMLAAHFIRLAAAAAFGALLRMLVSAFWLLNKAMNANPIIRLITILSMLGAALAVAYRESATFRRIVDGAFKVVKAVAVGAIKAIIWAIDKWMGAWSTMLSVLGKVPGFDWATTAARKIDGARESLRGFAASLDALPAVKDLRVIVRASLPGNLQKLLDPDKPSTLTMKPPTSLGRQSGGIIPGRGRGDKVPLLAEPGEFVIRRNIVDTYGPMFFARLNAGEPALSPSSPARGREALPVISAVAAPHTAPHSGDTRRTIVVKTYLGRRQIAESVAEDTEDELARR